MKLLLILFITSMTLFASIAKVVALRGEAYIIHKNEKIKITLGSDIDTKDKIITKNAKLQLIFNDRTIITIGPKSEFGVDEYLNSAKKPKASFSMFRGTFKTITGKIGKIAPKRFKIKTKSATIGIRGTQLIVEATPQKMEVMCTQGRIIVTDNTFNKSVDVPAGFSTQVTQGEAPKPAEKISIVKLQNAKKKLEVKKEVVKQNKPAPLLSKKREQSTAPAVSFKTSENEKPTNLLKDNINPNINTKQNTIVTNIAQNVQIAQQNSITNTITTNKQIVSTIEEVINKPKILPVEATLPDATDQITQHAHESKIQINSNEYLSWGYWNNENRTTGTYLEGIQTAESVIQENIQNNFKAQYAGDIIGLENATTKVNGNFQMNVDFGSKHIGIDSYTIQGASQDYSSKGQAAMNSAGEFIGSLEGRQNSAVTGKIQGSFYGPNAEAIGGAATLTQGSNKVTTTFSGLRPN